MPFYGPSDEALNDPNIQFLMGKIQPVVPTLAPKYAQSAPLPTQPARSPYVPPPDMASVAPTNPAPPANVVAPAMRNQSVGGLIPQPVDYTQNPERQKLAATNAQIQVNMTDKKLNPRWWERLIAAAATGAQAYANGGRATPEMMEQASNIRNRRYNNAQAPLLNEVGIDTEAANQWDKQQTENYRQRKDVWTDTMALNRADREQSKQDALEERQARLDKIRSDDEKRKQEADDAKENNANRRADQMDRRLDIMEKNAGKSNEPKFSASEMLKLSSYARQKGKKIADLSNEEVKDALGGERGGSRGVSTFRDAQAIDKYSDQEYQKKRQQVRLDKATERTLMGDKAKPEEIQARYKDIEDQYNQWQQDFEKRKKNWYAAVGNGKTVALDEGGNEIKDDTAPAASESPKSAKGKQLDADTARSILAEAGGDKNKARQLAKSRGYQF